MNGLDNQPASVMASRSPVIFSSVYQASVNFFEDFYTSRSLELRAPVMNAFEWCCSSSISFRIVELKFNCIRLPFSLVGH